MKENKNNYSVYYHYNPKNDKYYIGITTQKPSKRWGYQGGNYKYNKHFWLAIQRDGWENFEHVVIETGLSKEMAISLEKRLIKECDSYKNGYNNSYGGETMEGYVITQSVKDKISKSSKERWCDKEYRQHMSEVRAGENNPMYRVSPKERMDEITYKSWLEQTISRVKSEDFRQRMREINLGKKYSADTNAKKGLKGERNPRCGTHCSEETKEKLRIANSGRKYSDEINKKKGHSGIKNPASRAVNQYDTDGCFIKQWDYISLAAKELQIRLSNIVSVCKGKRKTAGGYIWKYANKDKGESEYDNSCNRPSIVQIRL